LKEVGFKLGFAVLLAVDEAFLADDSGVVVACVSAWMSEIAPLKMSETFWRSFTVYASNDQYLQLVPP
jgi:hypothetical protein